MRRHKKLLWGGAVALAVLLAGYWIWYANYGIFSSQRFDAARWRAPMSYRGDTICHRGRMVADLRQRWLRPGQSAADVERLLGRPDEIDGSHWIYQLGSCRPSLRPKGDRTRFDVLQLEMTTSVLRTVELRRY